MTLSISPTIVDSYEYYVGTEFGDAERERAVYEELLAHIRGEPFEPSEAMLLGRAWHKAIETGDHQVDGFTFAAESLAGVRSVLPGGLIVEAAGELLLPEINVAMRLRADGIVGNEVHEIKTTSWIDPERYMQTIQWRCYLLAFDAVSATYHACKLLRDQAGIYGLAEYQPFRQYRYPAMRKDVVSRVAVVADFIQSQGLAGYRQEAA